jgi:hypothetical protein
MFRRTTLIWLLVTSALGFGLYQIKYEVQSQEEQLARINKQILDNEEAIQVLSAEWSYLNRPDRLAEMARRYLEMSPLAPAQFTQLGLLPDRDAVAQASAAAQPAPAAKPLPVRVPAPAAQTAKPVRPAVETASVRTQSPAQPSVHPPQAAPPKPAAAAPPAAAKPAQVHAAAYGAPAQTDSQPETTSFLSAPRVLMANLLQAINEAPPAATPARLPEASPGPR